MTDAIAGHPLWEITFDSDGDVDSTQADALLTDVVTHGVTDLFVFSHGWNNDREVARRLYDGFFGLLVSQLEHVRGTAPVEVGLAGVVWPSRRWSDEPVPDFVAPEPGHRTRGGDGAAAVSAARPGRSRDGAAPRSGPALEAQTLDDLRALFPAATSALQRMDELLSGPPDDRALHEFHEQLRSFAGTGPADDDGEGGRPTPDGGSSLPGMLLDEPADVYERYRATLQELGALPDGDRGGQAGLGDRLGGLWHGAKEALRQATYWQMKNRAGVVGRQGLGALLGRLHERAPDLRVHLVGHSFGARLVSYALAGLPEQPQPGPVKSVTLLQGAFSHFAFSRPLPFDAGRDGALAGMLQRVDGPVAVVFSEHDTAVGVLYPLASMASRDDSAAARRATWRWGAMGCDGAQGVQARLEAVRRAGPGTTYPFRPHAVVNLDASAIVCRGGPPSGAHSDIVHPELTWVALSAGGLV